MSVQTRIAPGVAILAGCATLAAGCALARSDVKSLTDSDARRIQLDTTIETTIAALNAIAPHCGLGRNARVRDEEFHVYEVVGRIARAKREPDHDIHIVLEDLDNPLAHLVVESDDPNLGANDTSPYRDRLSAARDMLDGLVSGPPGDRLDKLHGMTVRVTGVGFFDFNHLQIGRSRSCIELHPILTIARVNGAALEPTAASLDSRPRASNQLRSGHRRLTVDSRSMAASLDTKADAPTAKDR